ncbi:MAG: hypothetical protein IJ745_05370 [Bacteroidales bacterium]|nr:hypothetical protein [Bacteroidales bacterium]
MKHRNKKNQFLLAALLLVGSLASAQLTIPGTGVTYRLNNEDWRYLRSFELPEGGDVYLYCYTGHVLTDTEGDTVLPFLRIYVNKNYSGDIYELAYERYEVQPFQSINEYSKGDGLPSKGGLGYMGTYTNPADQKDYQFYMTYFKDRGATVEFRLETTKDTFEEMDFEFKDILSSIK